MKLLKLFSLSLVLCLAACSDDDSKTFFPLDNTPVVTIDGTGLDSTVDEDETFDLDISGTGNDVDVLSGNTLRDIDFSGTGSNLTFLGDVTAERLDVDGNALTVTLNAGTVSIDYISNEGTGNTFYVPTGFTFSIDQDDGIGTTVIFY